MQFQSKQNLYKTSFPCSTSLLKEHWIRGSLVICLFQGVVDSTQALCFEKYTKSLLILASYIITKREPIIVDGSLVIFLSAKASLE